MKLHVVLFGPPGTGKSKLAQHLSQTHKRAVLDLKDTVDRCIENETEGGKRAKEFLEKRRLEKEEIIEEREKLKKKAGKKASELDQKWGPVNEEQFTFLSEEIFEQCIVD